MPNTMPQPVRPEEKVVKSSSDKLSSKKDKKYDKGEKIGALTNLTKLSSLHFGLLKPIRYIFFDNE
jgi:hypothetical protein